MLADEHELLKKAACRRRKNKERQASLPLPEVTQPTGEISLEGAAMAHLRIDKLTATISETLLAAS
jgi:hypothetical protein